MPAHGRAAGPLWWAAVHLSLWFVCFLGGKHQASRHVARQQDLVLAALGRAVS
jgi:hypothetical protein